MRKLLIQWLATVQWVPAKELGPMVVKCPYCDGPSLTGLVRHTKDCIVKRTQDYLKRGQGRQQ